MTHSELNIKELLWRDVSDRVAKVHKPLADIIDAWDPGPKYKLFQATYHYGDNIFEANTLKLPSAFGLGTIPITDSRVPSPLKEALSYSLFPVGIILSKSVEVFFEHALMLIPFAVFGAGIPLGLLETFSAASLTYTGHVWNTNAGVRSLFMLPKISEKQAHRKLQKEFNFIEEAPKKYSDQFFTFRAMAQCPYFLREPWELEILFFSNEWFKKDLKNKRWLPFYAYLLDFFVQYSSSGHNKPAFDILLHLFANNLTEKKKRSTNTSLNMLKYLIEIMTDIAPGYRPATVNDNDYVPVEAIQQAYADVYKVNSFPTLMIPSHFRLDNNKKPLYFSVKYSSRFDVNPKAKESESVIADIFQLYSSCMDFFNFIKNDSLASKQTAIRNAVLATDLTYFYNKPYQSNVYNIFPSEKLPHYNSDFLSGFKQSSLPFADNSGFIRACIMLAKKVSI